MGLMDHHQTARLLYAVRHGVVVKGHQRPGVDDLGGDAVLGQLVGGLQGPADVEEVGNDGHVRALLLHVGLAEGDHELRVVGDLALGDVEGLVLEETDRVVIPDGGAEEARRLGGGRGTGNFQARNVHEDALQGLGVGCRVAPAGALLAAEYHGDLGVAAEDVAGLCHLVEDLVRRHKGEVPVHQLRHGPHTRAGRAQGRAHNGGLGDGGVADAVRAEFFIEVPGGAEDAAQLFHVLAHDEDPLVPAHLLGDDLADRLRVTQFSHFLVPPYPS